MIQIRAGLFETNSSSTDSFSHNSKCYLPGTVSYIIKVHSDGMTEGKEANLSKYLCGWFKEHNYARNHKVATIKKLSEEDNLTTYEFFVEGEFNVTLAVYVTEFYAYRGGYQESDEYWAKTYTTETLKEKDSLLDNFRDYVDANAEDIEFDVIDIKEEQHLFDQKDIDANLFHNSKFL